MSESYVEEAHEGGVSCQDELCRFAWNRELKSGPRLQEVNSYERNTYFIISQILQNDPDFCTIKNFYSRWYDPHRDLILSGN